MIYVEIFDWMIHGYLLLEGLKDKWDVASTSTLQVILKGLLVIRWFNVPETFNVISAKSRNLLQWIISERSFMYKMNIKERPPGCYLGVLQILQVEGGSECYWWTQIEICLLDSFWTRAIAYQIYYTWTTYEANGYDK